jgi:hypothetical protein
MSEEKATVNVGIGSWLGLLGIIFVLCKIFEIGTIATWSWWLVLLPFYVGLVIFLGIIAFAAVGAGGFLGVVTLYDMWERRKRRIAYEKSQVWKSLGGKE